MQEEPSKSREHPDSIKGKTLDLVKNQPSGNARRFSAFLGAKDFLTDLDKKTETIIEEQTEYYIAEKSEEADEAESSSRSSITSSEKMSDYFSQSNLSLDSLQKNNTRMQSAASVAEQFSSLSDYWKHQAGRRQSRIGDPFTGDAQKWTRISSQLPPKDGLALTPRQRQLLKLSQREKSGNSKSGGITLRGINNSNSIDPIGNRRLSPQKLY